MCEECLCNELNAENAADTLILADMHCAERLKEITIEYINRRVKYLIAGIFRGYKFSRKCL